jgi:hypothetical protein
MYELAGSLRFLYCLASTLLNRRAASSTEVFLQAAYQGFLRRDIDASGLAYYQAILRARTMTKRRVLRSLLQSEEYKNARIQSIAQFKSSLFLGLFLIFYLTEILKSPQQHQNAHFIKMAYRFFLKREPDMIGRNLYLHKLERRELTRIGLLNDLIHSFEFKRLRGLTVDILTAQHLSRMQIIQQHLPSARRILDLGGAAHNHPEGSLRAMGYPHQPEEIIIIDLPPEDRIGGVAHSERVQTIVTDQNITIRYLYHSMAELADMPDAGFDLIVSGESIEHVTAEEAEVILHEAYRILQPGGFLCLDTPNAALTRLQSPDRLIHPEHKKEYYVHEIEAALERVGFRIVERKGVSPMPQSYREGVFDYHELATSIGVCDDRNRGTCFL